MKGIRKFVEATKVRKPVPLLIKALALLEDHGGRALDLGCGAGIEAKTLAEAGFKVEAVDSSPYCIRQTRLYCRGYNVLVLQAELSKFKIKPRRYRIIVAWNSLPFLNKRKSREILLDIQDGLIVGGICVLTVFGPEDDWAKEYPKMSFWNVEELRSVWNRMRFLQLKEEKRFGYTVTGKRKFWYTIKCLASREK